MRILLLGEASNYHCTLAQGLRALGHDVLVVSDGCGWMNNERDIDITRRSTAPFDTLRYISRLAKLLPQLTGFDVVHIKNPHFLDLKLDKVLTIYRFLKKYNKKIFLGAIGTDYYYIKACYDQTTFRYSDYFIGSAPNPIEQNKEEVYGWTQLIDKDVNIEIAHTCDGIVACLYEYYAAYQPDFQEKLAYIPIPVNIDQHPIRTIPAQIDTVNFFIGIQKKRSQLKGTDILYQVLQEVVAQYPNESSITKAENIPLEKYNQLVLNSDVLIDQLYSYTPATNALYAMAKGIVVVSGGEPEAYELQGEYINRPIINVTPDRTFIYEQLEQLIRNKHTIRQLALDSRSYVEKHHHYIKVAQQMIDFWSSRF